MFITDDLRDEYTHKTFARARVSHHPSRHDRSSIIPRASSPPPSLTRARAEDSTPPPARESTSPVFVVFAPPKTWPRFDSHTVQPECARFPCARASSSSSSTSTDTFVSDTKIARHLVRDRRLTARARVERVLLLLLLVIARAHRMVVFSPLSFVPFPRPSRGRVARRSSLLRARVCRFEFSRAVVSVAIHAIPLLPTRASSVERRATTSRRVAREDRSRGERRD